MQGFLAKFFNGNPLASVTISGIVAALGGYLYAHFNQSSLTPLGVTIFGAASALVGVLTHHSNTPAAK